MCKIQKLEENVSGEPKKAQEGKEMKVGRGMVKSIPLKNGRTLEIYWTSDIDLFKAKVLGNARGRCLLLDNGGAPIVLASLQNKVRLERIITIRQGQVIEDFGKIFSADEAAVAKGRYEMIKLSANQANHLAKLGNDIRTRKIVPVKS